MSLEIQTKWIARNSIWCFFFNLLLFAEDDLEDSDYNITLNQMELTDLLVNTEPKIKGEIYIS